MSQPGDGSRERGGSFCSPENGRSGGNSGSSGGNDGGKNPKTDEEKALEDVSKHDPIQDSQSPEREPEFACTSSPTREHLGTCQRIPNHNITAHEMSSHGIARSSTPSMIPPHCPSHPEPPVTKSTLAELDVPRIVLNPKLRHDVNFDPDLHFRPNLDGEKGKKKLVKANFFWDVLKEQLQNFMSDPVDFQSKYAGKEWCLPATLRAIGEILETLVPPEDRSAVAAIMNVELLMQQFAKQVADLESLAGWLAKTLKMHCAPMRDEWVNEMVVQLSTGNQNRDVNLLAQGLQTLMGVLEAMKLDVANHQIRCLRPLLVQDTVDFEQTFFMKKIATGKVDINFAHGWYRGCSALPSTQMPILPGVQHDTWVFFRGFTNCLAPSHANERVPDTFMFDEERIIKLRAELLDAVNMEACIRLFRKVYADSQAQALQQRRSQPFKIQESQQSNDSGCAISGTSSDDDQHMSSPTIHELPDFNARVQASNKATEKGHFRKSVFPDQLVFEPYGSPSSISEASNSSTPSSSRSTSPLSFSGISTPQSIHSTPSRPTYPSAAEETTLLSDLAAILADITTSAAPNAQSTSHHHRWTMAAPHLALRILNSTSHPMQSYSVILPHLEQTLSSALSTTSSRLFLEAENSVLKSVSPVLSNLVRHFMSLNNTKLFEVAVLPRGRVLLDKLLKEGIALCDDEHTRRVITRDSVKEIARSMAHVGVLHWRVWGPLTYLVNPNESRDTLHETCEQPIVTGCAREPFERGVGSSSNVVSMRQRDMERDERERLLREKKRRSLRRRSGQGRWGGGSPS